jgi:hypothetical protein
MDQMLICSFAKNKLTLCQMQQTKDQGPYADQFLCKERINFMPDAVDQRPRTRCWSVPLQGTNQFLFQYSRPKTKDQILISSFAKNKSTSSQMLQTKDQGLDPNQFLCKEQIDFFPDAADQRPRTRS